MNPYTLITKLITMGVLTYVGYSFIKQIFEIFKIDLNKIKATFSGLKAAIKSLKS